MACVGGSSGKGQREHGSVEMLPGWTMSFPQLYLKDRVLPPADKTFHLATRAQGSQLSGGFPTRPCGQAFHPFSLPHSFFSFFLSACHCLSLWGVFELVMTATKSVHSCTHSGLVFFLFSGVFIFSYLLQVLVRKKSQAACNNNLLITETQLGLQRSLNNQAGGIISCVQSKQAPATARQTEKKIQNRNNEALGWKQHENNSAGFTL